MTMNTRKISFFLPAIFLLAILSGCAKKALTKNSSWENITVQPAAGIPEGFVMGVDISSLASVEASGAAFYDANGMREDPLALLKSGGANTVRIRVWNNPKDDNGMSYGGGNNDIETACLLGKRASKMGMDVIVNFQYSDFWTDENKQSVPKAWANLRQNEKAKALKEFTAESLQKLKDAGVRIKMVQIGNAMNNGFCGEIYDRQVYALVKAGTEAVREFNPNLKIIVHYSDPVSEGTLESKASLLEKYKVDYDIFGVTYYPYIHGDVKSLHSVLKKICLFHQKKVMVCETAYPFTDEDSDGYDNIASKLAEGQQFRYPLSVEGQAIAVRDVIDAVAKLEESGAGVVYFEPAWIPSKRYESEKSYGYINLAHNQKCWELYGCGWSTSNARSYDRDASFNAKGNKWDNQAFFDFDGKVMDSVNVWKYAKKGSSGPLKVVRIENSRVDFLSDRKNELPSTVKILYNDGTIAEEQVEWDKAQTKRVLSRSAFGEYKVYGMTRTNEQVECIVNVAKSNRLVNGDFEKGNFDGWTVDNTKAYGYEKGKGNPKVENNSLNAWHGECYATGWEPDKFDFTMTQEVKDLEQGTYKCFAYFGGTGVNNPSGTSLRVEINRKDGTQTVLVSSATIPNKWKEYQKVEVPEIKVDRNVSSVTVKVRLAANFSYGSRGSWIVCDDVNLVKWKK